MNTILAPWVYISVWFMYIFLSHLKVVIEPAIETFHKKQITFDFFKRSEQ